MMMMMMMMMVMMMKLLKSLHLIEKVQCQKIFAGLDDIMMTLDDIDASKRNQTLTFNLHRATSI